MPISVDDFKNLLATESSESIVKSTILAGSSVHVSDDNINYIKQLITRNFSLDDDKFSVGVVGSAHLGFSISEKRKEGRSILPRYRQFNSASDIDVVVISAELYQKVWGEISIFSHAQPMWPWRAGRCGDYHVCGWLRSDQFPPGTFLFNCERWKRSFQKLSTEARFGRRQVRGGLFYSIDFAIQYYKRAVEECQREVRLIP